MKYLKIVFGLALVAGLMSVVASPAMAVPRWVHCVKVEKGKWLDNNCTKAGEGTWETKELVGTSEVTSSGELELEDRNATGGAVDVKCAGTNTGWVANLVNGTAGEDGVTSIHVALASCKLEKKGACEKVESVEAVNLPWGTRLVESGSEVRDELISGNSTGAPGWAVKCKTILGPVTDTCTISGSTQNVRSNRATGKTEFIFDETTHLILATCSQGGAKAGFVTGTIFQQLRSGNGLWILAPNLGT